MSPRVRAHTDGVHVLFTQVLDGGASNERPDFIVPSASEDTVSVSAGPNVAPHDIPPGTHEIGCRTSDDAALGKQIRRAGTVEVVDPDHVWIAPPARDCPTYTPDLGQSQVPWPAPPDALRADVATRLTPVLGATPDVEITGYPDVGGHSTFAATVDGHGVAWGHETQPRPGGPAVLDIEICAR